MSVRITSQENVVALFDSVTGWAFGPTFICTEHAEDFLEYLISVGVILTSASGCADLPGHYDRWLDLTDDSGVSA